MPVFALRGDGKVAVIETGGRGGTLGSISKDGRFLYVANNASDNRTVSIIDIQKLELFKNLEPSY